MDLRKALSAFVPHDLWPLVESRARESRAEGCVLFADLAGFTQLTDSLASIGKEGAEELTRILNDFFSAMIRIVHQDGGDVIRFGGDAMTIYMPSTPQEALKTSLRLQAETLKYQTVETRAGIFTLGMKIGVSSGITVFSIVGGDDVGYDYFAAGSALDLSAECEHKAKQGQIVLCPRSIEIIGAGAAEIVLLEGGFGLIENASSGYRETGASEVDNPSGDEKDMPSEETLTHFLPDYIKDKLTQKEEQLIGEHRRTSVLFLSFKGRDYDIDPKSVETAGLVYQEVAKLTKKYGGFINKIDMGDKGSKILAIFGSPLALEHQEEMACRCAMDIMASAALAEVVPGIKIGITVSSVFSAYVGCGERREYTVMGNGINLAARLMSASEPGSILVSEEVYEKARGGIDFETLEPINVKGKKDKVPIFCPKKIKKHAEAEGDFVGRQKELSHAFSCVKNPDLSANIAVTGAAGAGKSVFLDQIRKKCAEEGFECIFTRLASYDKDKFFCAWRGIVLHCLGIEHSDESAASVETVSSRMDEEDRVYLPLFKDILNIEIPENHSTKALTTKDRKDIFFAIISRLILRNTAETPHCIFIDHLDYADPSSIEFLSEIATDIRGTALKIIVTSRDVTSPNIKEVIENFETITINSFTGEEIREFLVQIAGFAPPTETFVNFLSNKTGGNPKFLEEVLQIMKREQLAFKGPSLLLEVDEDRLSSASFPDTLQGLFLSRVESLPEDERQILKSASILGPSFSIDSLGSILEKETGDIAAKIASMENTGLIKMDTWGTRPYASFTDNLLRDALYDSMNFQIRRELHKKVAYSLETYGSKEPRINAVLARHFESAGEDEKALFYLWQSAEYARSLYDNRSAFDYLGRYVSISESRGPVSLDDKTFLNAVINYADVQQELGRLAEADVFYKRILDEIVEVSAEKVKAYSRLADNKRRLGELKESLALYDKALEGAKLLKDDALTCRIFLDSGVPLAMMGKMGKAMDHFQRAEDLATRINDQPSLVYALMNRGLVEYFKGKLEGAKSLLINAREIAKENDLKSYLALITVNLAQVHFEIGEYKKALAICKEAVDVSRQFGYRNHLVIAMSNEALFATMLGDFDEAMNSVEKALLSAKHYGMSPLVAANLHTESLLWFVNGWFSKAIDLQKTALSTYIAGSHFGEALGCLSEIIAVSNYLKLPDLAAPAITEFLPKLQNETQNVTRTWTISYMAHHAGHRYLQGDLDADDAIENLENILDKARESGIVWLVAEVGNVLLKVFQKVENHKEAVARGMELFPLLSRHYCPLLLPPFLITLGNSLLETGSKEELEEILEALSAYEGHLDRGPRGLSYNHLLYKVSLRGPDPGVEAGARIRKALEILEKIESYKEPQEIKEAFSSLSEYEAVKSAEKESLPR
jgi:adenylate cyclase